VKITSVGPFLTGSLVWRPAPDRWVLTVVAKATFTLKPGKVSLAAEQQVLNERERHWSDDEARSLYSPSDLVPFKRRVDVVLVGQAFAPRGAPARSLTARLLVGEIDKSIEVHPDRALTREGELREGARWASMPLLYERAAGGPDTWNPVGVSREAPLDGYGQRLLPNLQTPSTGRPEAELAAPIGFAPIPASWRVRRDRLRRRAEDWNEASLEDELIGDDFDAGYFQAAPQDQQLEALRDEEPVVLENLLADHPRLTTQLSGLQPKAFVDIPGQAPRDLRLVADTLWIDTDRGICTVTWRGQVPLVARDQPGRVLVAAAGPGQRLTWANLTALLKASGGDTDVTPARDEEGRAPPRAKIQPAPRDVTVTSVGKPLPPVLPFGSRGAGVPSPLAASLSASSSERVGARVTEVVHVPEGAINVPAWMSEARGEQPLGPSATSAPTPPPRPTRAPAAAAVPPPMVPSFAASVNEPAVVKGGLSGASGEAAAAAPLNVASQPRPWSSSPLGSAPAMPARVVPEDRIALGGVDEKALAKAAFVGVAAASDAAAGGAPGLARSPSSPSSREALTTPGTASLLELLWFDAAEVARIRLVKEWAALLRPPPKKAPVQRGAPPPPPDPPSVGVQTERADVAAVLARAGSAKLAAIDAAITGALGNEGDLEAPLLVVAGELELGFDKLELLKATTATATPLGGADKRLKEVLDLVAEMSKTDLEFAPETIDRLVGRVREAWSKANRQLPTDHIEALPERMLLERRQYAKRTLLDGEWIRATVTVDGVAVPAYLPEALSKRLPLYRRFAARAIVEAIPQQDQYETSPIALRVVALGRALPPLKPQRTSAA
jgi:hypothetical protein